MMPFNYQKLYVRFQNIVIIHRRCHDQSAILIIYTNTDTYANTITNTNTNTDANTPYFRSRPRTHWQSTHQPSHFTTPWHFYIINPPKSHWMKGEFIHQTDVRLERLKVILGSIKEYIQCYEKLLYMRCDKVEYVLSSM